MAAPIITLTTDFGDADHYVACMKGVILGRCPDARIIDACHTLRPQDVVHAAFILRRIIEHFPSDTIHIAVVDPGVGTTRRILAARYNGQLVLAPDNGLVSLVHSDFAIEALHEVRNAGLFRSEVSTTFHGRDIFAPVAAALAAGTSLEDAGPPTEKLEILHLERPTVLPDKSVEGQVLYIDRYGNLITNIPAREVPPRTAGKPTLVFVGAQRAGPLRAAYAEVGPGEVVAMIGSSRMLEVAVNQGDAAAQLRAAPGTVVLVR
ncbi:MAG: S-adenosyl-l-methionine hydroxide adenosyltransferase family protein [Phycisphaerae bacterium]